MKRKLFEELYTKPDVATGENIFYKDELLSIPFNGVVVDFFKGILSWEFEVQDGFKTGIEKTYYETGELEVENSTFMDVHNWAITKGLINYREGIKQGLVDGKMEFLNSFIQYGQYELYFYGKSKKTKVSGFRFVFNE